MSTLQELLARETPEMQAKVQERAEEMLLELRLSELRRHLDITQKQLAATMGVAQPTISDIERDGRDLKISTLKRYVEAAGSKLKIAIELPDGTNYGFAI